MELWVSCVAGALKEDTYRTVLTDAGFDDVGILVTRDSAVTSAVTSGRDPACTHAPAGGGVNEYHHVVDVG